MSIGIDSHLADCMKALQLRHLAEFEFNLSERHRISCFSEPSIANESVTKWAPKILTATMLRSDFTRNISCHQLSIFSSA